MGVGARLPVVARRVHAWYRRGRPLSDGLRTLGTARQAAARSRKFMSQMGQEWSNANRSLGSRRSTETNGQEVPLTAISILFDHFVSYRK
jgi:hypothetical protein